MKVMRIKRGREGRPGIKGDQGDPPLHQWDGTKLRFEKPSGWGDFIDLKGEKGDSGQDAAPVDYSLVLNSIKEEVSKIPAPQDGAAGADGKEGTGVKNIRKNGNSIEFDLTDGSKKSFQLPKVKDGKDGVSISAIDFDGENIIFSLNNGKNHSIKMPEISASSPEFVMEGQDIMWKLDTESDWRFLFRIPLPSGGFPSSSRDAVSGQPFSAPLERTITPQGVTGDVTINTPLGSVNFAAGMWEVTISNGLVDENSIIFCQIRTIDEDMIFNPRVVDVSDGQFTLVTSVVSQGEVRVDFEVR